MPKRMLYNCYTNILIFSLNREPFSIPCDYMGEASKTTPENNMKNDEIIGYYV